MLTCEEQRQLIKEAEASSEESDGGKGLMMSWEEQRQLIMSRGRKPQQNIGASVSIKDRMRAFNASCSSIGNASSSSMGNASSSSMGALTDSHLGENDESSRVRKVPGMKTKDEKLTSKGQIQATLKEPDVGKDHLEDYEASISSLVAQIASHSTEYDSEDKDGGDNEAYQVEHQINEAEGSSEESYGGKGLMLTCEEQRQLIKEAEASREESDGGKGLMMSWEEQRQLLMSRDRKPVRNTGATVSLKDRMRAFTH
jgi:hypothetical protein